MTRTMKLAPWLVICLLVAVTGVLADDDGKILFETKCATCHGKDGVAKPMAKGSANLNDPAWQAKTKIEAVEQRVIEGKAPLMKPFKDKLTPEQIKAVAAYVKTLK